MPTNIKIHETLSAINKIEESRVGGWIHHSKLNISVTVLLDLIDKKFIEPGGMYSRLTQHGKVLVSMHDQQKKLLDSF